ESGRSSFHERAVTRHKHVASLLSSLPDDLARLGGCLRRSALRNSSTARRIRRLGRRTQGCAQRVFLPAHVARLSSVCFGTRTAKSEIQKFLRVEPAAVRTWADG